MGKYLSSTLLKYEKKMAKSTLCIQRLLLQRRDQINFPVKDILTAIHLSFLFFALSPNIKVYCCTMDISRAQNKISKKVLSPVLIGLLVGPGCLTGMLAGAISSGAMMAIMMSNAGGAWDNSKKYIEIEKAHGGKGTDI